MSIYSSLFINEAAAQRPRVFVSYHHENDQAYYEEFSRVFHDYERKISDRSLETEIESKNVDYILRRIRDDYLTGSSTIIVLCGAESHKRKWIDWEVGAALNQKMALVAVILPTVGADTNGKAILPTRVQANIRSGYAVHCYWNNIVASPKLLSEAVTEANRKSKSLIVNPQDWMSRNG